MEHEKCSVPSTCPPFRLLEQRPQYDIRQYAAHKWASTIVMNENRLLAQWEGLARLQEYFAGHNEQGPCSFMLLSFSPPSPTLGASAIFTF